jgi:hypothetical protein
MLADAFLFENDFFFGSGKDSKTSFFSLAVKKDNVFAWLGSKNRDQMMRLASFENEWGRPSVSGEKETICSGHKLFRPSGCRGTRKNIPAQ